MTRAEYEAFAMKYAKWAEHGALDAADTGDTIGWVQASASYARKQATSCEEYARRAEES